MPDAARREALFRDLENALDTDAFEPAFQPVAHLSDGRIAGFESLARWRRAPDVLIEPAHFMEEAINRDLVGRISSRIMRAACATMARWRADGVDDLFFSVNVAGRDLERADFVDEVLGVIAGAGVPTRAIKIEITEQQVLHDPARVCAPLERLREAGVKILFDDFGSGYSSFTWLTRLPADALKFDHDLIAPIAEKGPHYKIVAAMIALAHDLGLETIAEGVETEAQRDMLAALGCDFAQGHFYARALGEADARGIVGR
jgi:c-di-GMP-specific phosphodiesterase